MVKPPINKKRLAPGTWMFSIRVPSPKFYSFISIIKVFIGMLRGKLRNPVFGNMLYRF